MRKVTLYVPVDTEAQDIASGGLEDALLREYGGYTRYGAARGEWRDATTGRVYSETALVYVVLCADESAAVAALLQYGRDAGEKAVAYDVAEVKAVIVAVGSAA